MLLTRLDFECPSLPNTVFMQVIGWFTLPPATMRCCFVVTAAVLSRFVGIGGKCSTHLLSLSFTMLSSLLPGGYLPIAVRNG